MNSLTLFDGGLLLSGCDRLTLNAISLSTSFRCLLFISYLLEAKDKGMLQGLCKKRFRCAAAAFNKLVDKCENAAADSAAAASSSSSSSPSGSEKKKKSSTFDANELPVRLKEYKVNYTGSSSDPLYDVVESSETKEQKKIKGNKGGKHKKAKELITVANIPI